MDSIKNAFHFKRLDMLNQCSTAYLFVFLKKNGSLTILAEDDFLSFRGTRNLDVNN
jgi:hypothetical protein